MDGRDARLAFGRAFAYLKKLDGLRREGHRSAVKAARDEGRYLGFAECLSTMGCELVSTPKQSGANMPDWAHEDDSEIADKRIADALLVQLKLRELAVSELGTYYARGELKGFEDAIRVAGFKVHKDARRKAVNVHR